MDTATAIIEGQLFQFEGTELITEPREELTGTVYIKSEKDPLETSIRQGKFGFYHIPAGIYGMLVLPGGSHNLLNIDSIILEPGDSIEFIIGAGQEGRDDYRRKARQLPPVHGDGYIQITVSPRHKPNSALK